MAPCEGRQRGGYGRLRDEPSDAVGPPARRRARTAARDPPDPPDPPGPPNDSKPRYVKNMDLGLARQRTMAMAQGFGGPPMAPHADATPEVDVDLELATDLRVHPWTFLEFFLLHIVTPLGIPYVAARHGWQAVLNLRLVYNLRSRDDGMELRLWSATLAFLARKSVLDGTWLVLALAALGFATRWDALAAQRVHVTELAHAFLMYAAHRTMVGVKYSVMAPGELALFLRGPYEAAIAYANRIQLLTGVWFPQPDVVRKEVMRAWRLVEATGAGGVAPADAATRQFSFEVRTREEVVRWQRLLSVLGDASPFAPPPTPPPPTAADKAAHESVRGGAEATAAAAVDADAPAHVALPASVRVDDVLGALVLRATYAIVTPEYVARTLHVSRAVAIVFGLQPSVLRAWYQADLGQPIRPFGTDAVAYCVTLSLALITAAWWSVNILFLMCAESWYRRIALQRRMLSALLASHDGPVHEGGGERVSDWPTLDLSNPSVVRVFSLLWRMQLAYGRAYSLRMTVFNALVLGFASVAGAYLVWLLYAHERLGDDSIELRHSLPVNLVLLMTVVLSAVFFFQLRAGSAANDQLEELDMLLLAGVTRSHYELEVANRRLAEPAVAADRALAAGAHARRFLVLQAIQELHHEAAAIMKIATAHPVRLLGVRASLSLAGTFGTTFGTVCLVLIDRIYDLGAVAWITSVTSLVDASALPLASS